MADSASGMTKVLATTTTFIEKAVEFRHFMLIISFLLALDSCLVIFYNKNLLESFAKLNAPEVSVASALVFLGIFAFLMALLFPALRLFFIGVTRFISAYTRHYASSILPERSRDNDYTFPSAVRAKAITERDKLLLDLVHKHEEEKHNHEVNMNIAFAMVVLFVMNSLILGTAQSMTLTQVAGTLPERINGFWLSAFIHVSYVGFGAFVTIVLGMSLKPDNMLKMYMPESDTEKDARIDKETARRKIHLG